MTLGERINLIITSRNIKQVEFADSLGVSANYINQLVNDKKVNISETLARLIEETYGYSAEWIMTGEGEITSSSALTTAQMELLKKIQKMPDDEVIALLAFSKYVEDEKANIQKINSAENETTEK